MPTITPAVQELLPSWLHKQVVHDLHPAPRCPLPADDFPSVLRRNDTCSSLH